MAASSENSQKVSVETKNVLEGLRTEIGASRALTPSDNYNKGRNAGMNEAIKLIRRYERGEGLWQITTT